MKRRFIRSSGPEDLLRELAEKWVERGIRSREAAERVCDDIRAAFAEQDVPRHEYETLIASMPGADPDDHPHAAAAVARAPVTILTHNVTDFPAEPLAERDVTVRAPDDYLIELFDSHPAEIAHVVNEMAASRSRPPVTPRGVLDTLARAGVPRFVERVRERL